MSQTHYISRTKYLLRTQIGKFHKYELCCLREEKTKSSNYILLRENQASKRKKSHGNSRIFLEPNFVRKMYTRISAFFLLLDFYYGGARETTEAHYYWRCSTQSYSSTSLHSKVSLIKSCDQIFL